MSEPQSSPAQAKQRLGPRGVFTLALAWAALLSTPQEFFGHLDDLPLRPLPTIAVLGIVLWLASLGTRFLGGRWPGFLRLPNSTSRGSYARMVGIAALPTAVTIGTVASLATILAAPRGHINPRQDLAVLLNGLYYPLVLTPAIALLLGWWRTVANPARDLPPDG